MNHLLTDYADGNTDDKKVLEQDMLFATLDTTVRKISPAGHRSFLLSDTVGFIDDLPTTLVKAFRSTLEEIKYADILLEVIDFSDPDYNRHMEVTDKTLSEIGAGDIPKIYVFNKSDIADEQGSTMVQLPYVRDHRIYMAAKKDIGTEELLSLIDKVLLEGSQECELIIPYSQGAVVAAILDGSEVLTTEYLPEGTKIRAKLKKQDINKYAEYISSTS
jgi:GTP-binding protein HflX